MFHMKIDDVIMYFVISRHVFLQNLGGSRVSISDLSVTHREGLWEAHLIFFHHYC